MKLTVAHLCTTALAISLLELGHSSSNFLMSKIGISVLAISVALLMLDLTLGAVTTIRSQLAGHALAGSGKHS